MGLGGEGSGSQSATSVLATAPGVRKAAVRELLASLRSEGQVRFLPSAATDASLGYSAMAGQSAQDLFENSEGGPARPGAFGGDHLSWS